MRTARVAHIAAGLADELLVQLSDIRGTKPATVIYDEIEAEEPEMNVQQVMAWIAQFGMDAFKALPSRPDEARVRNRSAGWRQKRRRKRERQTGRR